MVKYLRKLMQAIKDWFITEEDFFDYPEDKWSEIAPGGLLNKNQDD